MQGIRLLLLGLLVVTAGCSGGAITGGGATISDRTDRDCNSAHSAVTIDADFEYSESADLFSETDAYALAEFRPENGSWQQAKKLTDIGSGGFDRTISLTASDLGTEGRVAIRIIIMDADLRSDQQLGVANVGTAVFEPESADKGSLNPSFRWSSPVSRGETVTFEAVDRSNSECEIVSFNWNFDGDSEYEEAGQQVSYTYDTDGYYTVELTLVDSRGRTETTTQEILVMYDPDDDGVTSAVERKRGMDPNDPDTDDDLFNDGIDPMPTSFFVPTGLIQVFLCLIVFILVIRFPRRVI